MLEAEGVIAADLSTVMQGWAGLRNVLVRLYVDIDPARIHEIVCTNVGRLDDFAAALGRVLDEEDSGTTSS